MNSSFIAGFRYALQGIGLAVRQERNFRFHLAAAFYVYVFSLFYRFSGLEYMLITALVGGVLALELVNSAVERAVDNPRPENDRAAGAAKDLAAGAVLVFALAAAVCGFWLFWRPVVLAQILSFFTARPFWALGLLISLGLSYWFVFRLGSATGKEKGKPNGTKPN